ncbi:MAG: hypothetical protein ACKOXT_00895 [Actinomycetota bacterium]
MSEQPAESTAVTKSTVVRGLGYPNDRLESSPQPTGWLVDNSEVSKVSRGTFE